MTIVFKCPKCDVPMSFLQTEFAHGLRREVDEAVRQGEDHLPAFDAPTSSRLVESNPQIGVDEVLSGQTRQMINDDVSTTFDTMTKETRAALVLPDGLTTFIQV